MSVIVPARDAEQTLAWALSGLETQDFEGEWELILVDDGSRDATVEVARRSPLAPRVVRLDGQGPARARNAGVMAAKADRLAFLDADCRPSPAWLGNGVAALASAELALGATCPDPEQPIGPFDRTLWVRRPSGLFESANMFVRRELFESLGGFESWLRPVGGKELGEDVWFGWRAQRHGASIAFCEEALVHHAVFARGVGEYVAERTRLRFFPAMARRVPELREHFFYRRWFLSRRSAAFDLALASALVAATLRRPLALVGVGPYARVLSERMAGGSAAHAVRVALADLAADAVGFGALLAGAAASGSVVL